MDYLKDSCISLVLYILLVGLSSSKEHEDLADTEKYEDNVYSNNKRGLKCENITVLATPDWYELRPIKRDKKWLLPFFLSMGDKHSTVLLILAGLDFKFNTSKEEDTRKIIITFEFNKITLQVGDTEGETSGIIPMLFKPGQKTGFWVKVHKDRDSETGKDSSVGVYSSTEGRANPLVKLTMEDQKDISADKFTFMKQGEASVQVSFDCSAGLGQLCSHDRDCRTRNAKCMGSLGKEPDRIVGPAGICHCGDQFSLNQDGICVDRSFSIGEECTTSKQCTQYQAKCRRQKNDKSMRRCQCGKRMEIRDGKCTEVKDKVRNLINLGMLNRNLSWSELNPGRKTPSNTKSHRGRVAYPRKPGAMMHHCALEDTLDVGYGNPDWPVWWDRNGFVVAGFYRSVTSGWDQTLPASPRLALTFSDSGVDPVMSLEFGDEEIVFKERGEIWVFNETLRRGEFVLFNRRNTPINYQKIGKYKTTTTPKHGELSTTAASPNMRWFSIQYECEDDTCSLTLSRGQEGADEKTTYHHTPRYQHQQLVDKPGIAAYSLFNAGGVKVEVAAECLGGVGDKCVHSAQCLPPGSWECLGTCSGPQMVCTGDREGGKSNQDVSGAGIATSCQCSCHHIQQ